MIAIPSRIEPQQRFTKKTLDCPICGGNADDRRGHGVRCWGYISHDGRYAHCTQIAGGTLQQRGDGTYKHRIDGGACWCGDAHGNAAGAGEPMRQHTAPERETPPAKVWAAIPDWLPGADGYRRTATYDYRDAAGALVYTIARYERTDKQTGERRKEIRPFCPVPDGWEMRRAAESILYRLPELLAADPWAPVYICEGEKDADRLAAAGLVATTNAFGAGSWHTVADAARVQLAGRAAVITEHNDDAGRARTPAILASLEGASASIRVMRFTDLPEHGDVSDWLDVPGHTASELHRMCATLPVWMPSAQHSSPASQDETAPACLSCARKDEQLRASEAARKVAETSLANLRRERAIEDRILATDNETKSAPLKVTELAFRREAAQGGHQRNEKGLHLIPRAFIAQRIGVKPNTAGKHLVALAKQRVIVRDERKTFDQTDIYYGEGENYNTPENVEKPERANTWGGARPKRRCKSCYSPDLDTRHTCKNCGDMMSDKEALEAAVTYDLAQAAQEAQSQETSPASQDETADSDACATGDTDAASQHHSPPPDMRVNGLVTLDSEPDSDTPAPLCPDCGKPARPSRPFPGRWVCFPCARMLDEPVPAYAAAAMTG